MCSKTFFTFALVMSTCLQTWNGIAHAGDTTFNASEELQQAYQHLLKDPGDLERLYAYARAAIREGTFEAAIGVLEGMLVISRNQPRVLLELGTLYQGLGAPRVAAAYLKEAEALSDAETRVAEYAREYLRSAEKETAPNRFNGFVQFGLRYQSNPTLSPENSEIFSGGFRIPLPEDRDEDGDTNAVLLSVIEHRYTLGQRTSLASDAIIYGTLYDDNSDLNYGGLELASGIRYTSPMNAGGQYSFRPHLVMRGAMSDGDLFEKTAGLGIDFDLSPGNRSRFKALYQYRDVNFNDINGRGTASQRSGGEHRLDLRAVAEVARGHVVMLRLFGRHHDTEQDYFDVNQFDVTLRYSAGFSNFLFEHRPLMKLSPYVIRRIKDYGDADPGIDPGTDRNDKEWRIGLDYSVPFSATWSAVLNLEYAKVNSNIVNYDTKNKLVMLGLRKRF